MQRETTLGFVWAASLVLAMVGVFLYGLTAYEPQRFDVAWSENQHERTVAGDDLTVGASGTHAFVVPGSNVTRVEVALEWTDPIGPDNDDLELYASGPAGAADTAHGTTGGLALRFVLAEPPGQTQVEGANAAHALERLDRPNDPWRGEGTWNVTVRLIAAEGSTGTQGLGLDGDNDDTNDYTVRFVFVTTDATLAPAT